MSVTVESGGAARQERVSQNGTAGNTPVPMGHAAQYGITLLLVAVATLLAFVVDHIIAQGAGCRVPRGRGGLVPEARRGAAELTEAPRSRLTRSGPHRR